MALAKADIIEHIQERFSHQGWNRKQCVDIAETLIEIMKRTIEKGEDVLISGFGKFIVKEKRARRGRNPATGESMLLDARRVVTFKCSGKLRQQINNNSHETK